ncbi:CHASE domain-containing protein [Candidatus Halocynthiibacter alkanivorans]|uniref:CHASE domain-containing protein n=1 Tax=Candidatus Halocynthiibacter alkanivorans TaxID=2267619 RepID=UPI000DF20667|nr:CHASE domain-containing protein [Candidatus Halocynthiibacter alkanivorans]
MTAQPTPTQFTQPHRSGVRSAGGFSWQFSLPTVLICALGFAASVAAFFEVSDLEKSVRDEHFNRLAQEQSQAIQAKIEASTAALRSVRGLFDASDDVTRAQFGEFIESLEVDDYIQALEWIPRVRYAERPGYEDLAREDGLSEFQLTERTSQGAIVPAGVRDEYYPVYFVEPVVGNEKAIGFDLGSSATRLAALREARSSGGEVASARITLVQETGEQFGFLIFVPVYEGADTPTSAQDREAQLRGFGLGVYRMGDLVASASIRGNSDTSGIEVFIFDKTAETGQQLLFPKDSGFESDESIPSRLRLVSDINFSGRTWRIVSVPSADSVFTSTFLTPWLVMVLGFLITGFAALYLNVVLNRKRYADTLVETRTAELVAVNLEREQIMAELKRSNEDLESFTFVASHDLKAPLRGIDNLVSWIVEDDESHLSEESKHNAERLRVRVKRLDNLLDGLLEYSRLGRMVVEETSVDTQSMCMEIAEYLAPPKGFVIQISDELPRLTTSKPALQTVLNNLISNAIKHHDLDTGEISVSSEDLGRVIKFSVSDDGPGIDPMHHKRIFQAFQTLAPRSKVDTSGIGLALVARTVAAAGGAIKVYSEVGKRGTTMSFTWTKSWPKTEV